MQEQQQDPCHHSPTVGGGGERRYMAGKVFSDEEKREGERQREVAPPSSKLHDGRTRTDVGQGVISTEWTQACMVSHARGVNIAPKIEC